LEDAAHGRHTDPQSPLLLELGTELCQGRIGLLLDQPPHERQGWGIAARLTTSCMGPWCNLPCGALPLQQFLEERWADPEQGCESALRAKVVLAGT
jgi:hypothetical protein